MSRRATRAAARDRGARATDEQPSVVPRPRRPARGRTTPPTSVRPFTDAAPAADAAGPGGRAAPRGRRPADAAERDGRPRRDAGPARPPSGCPAPTRRLVGADAAVATTRPLRRRGATVRVSPSAIEGFGECRCGGCWRGRRRGPDASAPPTSAPLVHDIAAELRRRRRRHDAPEVDAPLGPSSTCRPAGCRRRQRRGAGDGDRLARYFAVAREQRAGSGSASSSTAGRRSGGPCSAAGSTGSSATPTGALLVVDLKTGSSKPTADEVGRAPPARRLPGRRRARRLRRARQPVRRRRACCRSARRAGAKTTLQEQLPVDRRRRPRLGRRAGRRARPRAWPARGSSATRRPGVPVCAGAVELPGPARGAGDADADALLRRARSPSALGQPAPTPEQQARHRGPAATAARRRRRRARARPRRWPPGWSGWSPTGYVEPEQVLGLTFTRKAAGELARAGRAGGCAGSARGLGRRPVEADGAELLAGTPTVSTYHSYAGRLVAEHGLRLGIEPERPAARPRRPRWQLAAEVVDRVRRRRWTTSAAPPPPSPPRSSGARRRAGRAPARPGRRSAPRRRGSSARARRCPTAPAGPGTCAKGVKDAADRPAGARRSCCRWSTRTLDRKRGRRGHRLRRPDGPGRPARRSTRPRSARASGPASGSCCSTSTRTPATPSSCCSSALFGAPATR